MVVFKLGSRRAVFLGSLAYFFYIAGLSLPTFKNEYPDSSLFLLEHGFIEAIIIICSMIKGFGGSLFWIGGLSYVRECSSERSKGTFYAMLYCASSTNGLIGNLLSAFLLGKTNKFTYFMVMGAISISASVVLAFLITPISKKVNQYEQVDDQNS